MFAKLASWLKCTLCSTDTFWEAENFLLSMRCNSRSSLSFSHVYNFHFWYWVLSASPRIRHHFTRTSISGVWTSWMCKKLTANKREHRVLSFIVIWQHTKYISPCPWFCKLYKSLSFIQGLCWFFKKDMIIIEIIKETSLIQKAS